jgi:uncharacterized protein DUF5808/uncharacterized protein DUF1648
MTSLLLSSALPTATLPGPVAACACLLVVIGVVAWLAPGFPRGRFFSVIVQPWLRATPEGRQILWWYRMKVQLHTLIGFVLMVLPYPAAGTSVPWFVAALAGLGWQLGGCFFAYQGARRQVLPHGVDPASVREAEIARGTGPPGGWTLQAGPFAALAGAALYLRSRWAGLPDRFPVHWGFDGRPNGWANRNLAGVFGPLIIAAVIAAGMVLVAGLRQRQARTAGSTHAPAAAERRFRRAMLWAMLASEYLLVLVSIWVSLLPLAAAAPGGTAAPPRIAPFVALILIFVVTVTIILARIGHGARMEAARDGVAKQQSGGAPLGRRSPESCWKAGIFYVNPDDPAIFVEKRFGIGYTLNFGHPLSWLILGLSILAPLAVAAWVAHAAS